MLLGQAVEIWLERYKKSSRSINEHRLNKFLKYVARDVPLVEVSVHDMLRYERGLKAHRFIRNGKQCAYSQKTLRMHMIAVKTFFSWCIKSDLIKENPTRLMQPPLEPVDRSRDKVMSEEDLQVLLAYVRTKPFQNAIVTFAYQTAARTGEVCSLRLSQLNLDNPIVGYNPATGKEVRFYTTIVSGKTGEREVGFYQEAATALRYWLIKRPACDHDFVFITQKRTPLTSNTCKKVMARLKKAIQEDLGYEMSVCNIQSMRKRMGYAMGDSDAALPLIQAKLGHRSPQSTMVYMPNDGKSAFSRAAAHIARPALPSQQEQEKTVNLADYRDKTS